MAPRGQLSMARDTQVEVLSAGRDYAGGYKVDVTRGTRVGRVSSE
ncbi:hypothetical protein ACVIHI_008868 [Bradyrhizobium sp. USDA 4524]|nr:hypothetical protein [Bradyrhizobium sp. USDA 4538]MCP1907013.1 hypothetical protein [Bradyrhizobium sp. USDA 4537]MCP1985489.1 hypothetical protein [Bradyrhizobium sp. USDA 4539]